MISKNKFTCLNSLNKIKELFRNSYISIKIYVTFNHYSETNV